MTSQDTATKFGKFWDKLQPVLIATVENGKRQLVSLYAIIKPNFICLKAKYDTLDRKKQLMVMCSGAIVLLLIGSCLFAKETYEDPEVFIIHLVEQDMKSRKCLYDKYEIEGFKVLSVHVERSSDGGYEDTVVAKIRFLPGGEYYYAHKVFEAVNCQKIMQDFATDQFGKKEISEINGAWGKWESQNKMCMLRRAAEKELKEAMTIDLLVQRRVEDGVYVPEADMAHLPSWMYDTEERMFGGLKVADHYKDFTILVCKNPEGDLTDKDRKLFVKREAETREMNAVAKDIEEAMQGIWSDSPGKDATRLEAMEALARFARWGHFKDDVAVHFKQYVGMLKRYDQEIECYKRGGNKSKVKAYECAKAKVLGMFEKERKDYRDRSERELKKATSRMWALLDMPFKKYNGDFHFMVSENDEFGTNDKWRAAEEKAHLERNARMEKEREKWEAEMSKIEDSLRSM